VPLRRRRPPQAWSDQDEVDQREKARRHAAGDQGVIDADVSDGWNEGWDAFLFIPAV
jgi:hypothetical protein